MPARAPRIGAKPTGVGIKAGITIRGHLRLHPPRGADLLGGFLSRRADSNCRPAVYETAALPAELRRRGFPRDFGTS